MNDAGNGGGEQRNMSQDSGINNSIQYQDSNHYQNQPSKNFNEEKGQSQSIQQASGQIQSEVVDSDEPCNAIKKLQNWTSLVRPSSNSRLGKAQ